MTTTEGRAAVHTGGLDIFANVNKGLKVEDTSSWDDSMEIDRGSLTHPIDTTAAKTSTRRPRRSAKQPARYQNKFTMDENEDGSPEPTSHRRRPTRPGRFRMVPNSPTYTSSDCSSPAVPDVGDEEDIKPFSKRYTKPAKASKSSRKQRERTPEEEEEEAEEEENGDVDDSEEDEGSDDAGERISLIEKLLPGHKIARGRGRRKQLESMTAEEKQAEKEARMEKMRISARECRLRKKNNIATLEDKLKQFEQKDKRNRATIGRLRDEMRRLQENLRALSGVTRNKHPLPQHLQQAGPAVVDQARVQQQQHHLAQQRRQQQLLLQQQRKYAMASEPYERKPQISIERPTLSFVNRLGVPPATLNFAEMNNSIEGTRLPTPKTPLTPQLQLEDLIAPGFTLPTPPPTIHETANAFAFDYAAVDVDKMLLG